MRIGDLDHLETKNTNISIEGGIRADSFAFSIASGNIFGAAFTKASATTGAGEFKIYFFRA